MIKSLAKSWLVSVWPGFTATMACEIPGRAQAQAADTLFKAGVWQQPDDFAKKFIMVFWTFILVTLDLRGSVWCEVTLVPVTKPATSNLMLFVFQFSLCLCRALMLGVLLAVAAPNQCLFKVQLQTPASTPALQTAGKFTHLLTSCRTVCCTKASAFRVCASYCQHIKMGSTPEGLWKIRQKAVK